MTAKDVILAGIMYAQSNTRTAPYATRHKDCYDHLLKVGFRTFVVGRTRYILFRPTMNWLNWVLNILFPLYTIPYGNKESPIRVHSGFLACYLSLRDELHHIIEEDKEVVGYVFSGHSLGGALARLGALDVQYNFDKPIFAYAFGAPNIGNKEFEKSYEKRVPYGMSYVVKGDPVGDIPPELFSYKRYVRTSLKRRYYVRFWLNHLPSVYIENLEVRDTTKEIV